MHAAKGVATLAQLVLEESTSTEELKEGAAATLTKMGCMSRATHVAIRQRGLYRLPVVREWQDRLEQLDSA